jgi:hypothetical protein
LFFYRTKLKLLQHLRKAKSGENIPIEQQQQQTATDEQPSNEQHAVGIAEKLKKFQYITQGTQEHQQMVK